MRDASERERESSFAKNFLELCTLTKELLLPLTLMSFISRGARIGRTDREGKERLQRGKSFAKNLSSAHIHSYVHLILPSLAFS